MRTTTNSLNIKFWGIYDTGKPRLRILMRGLKENNVKITECHKDIWGLVEDKSQIKAFSRRVYLLIKILISYPFLICKFLVNKKPDILFIGYLGHLDIIVIYPFAKIFRVPIVWDPFISIYDTIVNDRSLLPKDSVFAKLLYYFEYLSCLCADLIVLDTKAHADYFTEQYKLKGKKICSVFVGVEPEFFSQKVKKICPERKRQILFYGQFIPLHGISTIVESAQILENDPIEFILIGTGQESDFIDNLIYNLQLKNITRINWVNYEKLNEYIATSDICLGIFGASEKASRVIPNKVFQILASGKPLITMDSPAIRELLPRQLPKITLVKPGNAIELSLAIKCMLDSLDSDAATYDNRTLLSRFTPQAIGQSLLDHIFKSSIIRKLLNEN